MGKSNKEEQLTDSQMEKINGGSNSQPLSAKLDLTNLAFQYDNFDEFKVYARRIVSASVMSDKDLETFYKSIRKSI